MSTSPQWSYVQARLQARHGERLDEGGWRALEAARTLNQFLERSRATPLRRFADHLNAQMSSHAMERMLRAAWRDYVAEIADWVTPAWQPAVQWTAHVPDLPVIDAVIKGKAPAWAQADPVFSALAEMAPQKNAPRRGNHVLLSLFPLIPAQAGIQGQDYKVGNLPHWVPAFAGTSGVSVDDKRGENSLPRRWLAHWRSLWPQRRGPDSDALGKFARCRARPYAAARARRRRRCQRPLSPRSGAGPDAHFSPRQRNAGRGVLPSGAVALDLERLRGGLVRRRLFETGNAAGMR